jgi:hypothetical protein
LDGPNTQGRDQVPAKSGVRQTFLLSIPNYGIFRRPQPFVLARAQRRSIQPSMSCGCAGGCGRRRSVLAWERVCGIARRAGGRCTKEAGRASGVHARPHLGTRCASVVDESAAFVGSDHTIRSAKRARELKRQTHATESFGLWSGQSASAGRDCSYSDMSRFTRLSDQRFVHNATSSNSALNTANAKHSLTVDRAVMAQQHSRSLPAWLAGVSAEVRAKVTSSEDF